MGPPSGVGTCGTAAATYVPTSPNIRIEILIACFMGFLLPRLVSQIRNLDAAEHYKIRVKAIRHILPYRALISRPSLSAN